MPFPIPVTTDPAGQFTGFNGGPFFLNGNLYIVAQTPASFVISGDEDIGLIEFNGQENTNIVIIQNSSGIPNEPESIDVTGSVITLTSGTHSDGSPKIDSSVTSPQFAKNLNANPEVAPLLQSVGKGGNFDYAPTILSDPDSRLLAGATNDDFTFGPVSPLEGMLQVWMSSDNGDTWELQDNAHAPQGNIRTGYGVATDGNELYFWYNAISNDVVVLQSFDPTTNLWGSPEDTFLEINLPVGPEITNFVCYFCEANDNFICVGMVQSTSEVSYFVFDTTLTVTTNWTALQTYALGVTEWNCGTILKGTGFDFFLWELTDGSTSRELQWQPIANDGSVLAANPFTGNSTDFGFSGKLGAPSFAGYSDGTVFAIGIASAKTIKIFQGAQAGSILFFNGEQIIDSTPAFVQSFSLLVEIDNTVVDLFVFDSTAALNLYTSVSNDLFSPADLIGQTGAITEIAPPLSSALPVPDGTTWQISMPSFGGTNTLFFFSGTFIPPITGVGNILLPQPRVIILPTFLHCNRKNKRLKC